MLHISVAIYTSPHLLGHWETELQLIKMDEIHCNDVNRLWKETLVAMGEQERLKYSIL